MEVSEVTTAATTIDATEVAGTKKTNKAAFVEEKPNAYAGDNDDTSLAGDEAVRRPPGQSMVT